MREIEEMLKKTKSTINCHIQPLGLIKILDICIQHEVKEFHLTKPPQTSKAELHQKKMMLSGGIGKIWYGLICFQETKRLIRMSTVVSCKIERSGQRKTARIGQL